MKAELLHFASVRAQQKATGGEPTASPIIPSLKVACVIPMFHLCMCVCLHPRAEGCWKLLTDEPIYTYTQSPGKGYNDTYSQNTVTAGYN